MSGKRKTRSKPRGRFFTRRRLWLYSTYALMLTAAALFYSWSLHISGAQGEPSVSVPAVSCNGPLVVLLANYAPAPIDVSSLRFRLDGSVLAPTFCAGDFIANDTYATCQFAGVSKGFHTLEVFSIYNEAKANVTCS